MLVYQNAYTLSVQFMVCLLSPYVVGGRRWYSWIGDGKIL